MVVAAAKSGYLQDDFAKALPRVQEIPFDSERKRMTTIHRNDGTAAVAVRLRATRRWSPSSRARPMSCSISAAPCWTTARPSRSRPRCASTILDQNRDMASDALRVLGVAYPPAGRRSRRSVNARDRREGSRLRRAARHDRPAAAGGDRGAEGRQGRGAARPSWSPATTRTPPRPSRATSGCCTPGGLVLTGRGDRQAQRRGTRGADRPARRLLPRLAAAQDAHRRCLQGARPRGGDDGRRRERRAGAQARQHRRRHGHHRHRRGQADGRHGAHRRQLRQHRLRHRAGADHLLEHPQVRVLPARLQRRARSSSSSARCSSGMPMPAAARAAPVAEPGERRRAGPGARAGEGRRRHHEAAAALAEGAGHQPRHGDRASASSASWT